MGRITDLTGRVFGELTVLEDDGTRYRTYVSWKCRCSCGKTVHVPSYSLTRGRTKSCGHLRRASKEKQRERYNKHRVDGVAMQLFKPDRKVSPRNIAGITGISTIKRQNGTTRYVANITVNKARHYLGSYSTLDEAIRARKIGETEFLPHSE